jgi:predicted short-subunit dehydrogenase-like oxidoreductase (DUF2520 family)
MRELERHTDTTSSRPLKVGVLGCGRMGRVLSAGLRSGGVDASHPLGRGADLSAYNSVLLCVPDGQIASVAALIEPGPLVGHCSGATGLEVLAPHEAFSLHPLMTVTLRDRFDRLVGAGAAISGSTPRAQAIARELAESLGMRPFPLADKDRAAYHAAASMASNFLVTLEAAAEQVADGTGAGRELIAPLVRATVENWASLGPEEALTGPVARGDEATVVAQRTAVAERAPELLELFDALVATTRALSARRRDGSTRSGTASAPPAAEAA